MTAIVGVLNKRAAVMAADSAVTVTRGTRCKIYNTATKIFRLSDDYPVGVMMFSSADFMRMPWDVIIKMYHKNRGKQCFDTLRGYVENFIEFLKTEPLLKDMQSLSHEYIRSEMATYYDKVKSAEMERVKEELGKLPDDFLDKCSNKEAEKLINKHILAVIKEISQMSIDDGVCSEFEDYSFNEFCNYAMDDFRDLMAQCKEDGIPTNKRADWERGFYCYITHGVMYQGTGLVFVGYGETEIFPSLIPVYLSGIIDGRLRYSFSDEETAVIANDNVAAIQPFAQTDVMQTMMKGIAPDLYELALDSHTTSVDSVKQKMIEVAEQNGASEDLLAKMRETDVDETKEHFDETIAEFVKKEYVEGIVDAVDSFGIEDMANMAESLVSITNLQRHMTSSEESVGGPVDVAVITRSDGFVWLKHKTND